MEPVRGPEPAAAALLEQLEQLMEEWMSPYLAEIDARYGMVGDKVINDAVWGSIRLFPWEVAVLDSPILQRLRTLRQLGVVHWVFPSAGHCRLEHSLGVVHQVQAIVDGIERNSGRAGDRLLPDSTVKLLRLTGLLHDCGHVVMSHVGERVFEMFPGVADLTRWIAKKHGCSKKPQASEVVAAAIIESRAFQRLLAHPKVGAEFEADPVEVCRRMAGLILGAPKAVEPAFAGGIISGPFDADKLDYMTRDARMAGIPNAVDVQRLTEKIHVVAVNPTGGSEDARRYRNRMAPEAGATVFALALPRAGRAVLEELAAARASLFTKVYYHQKVRVLEWMVRDALGRARWTTLKEWLSATDEQLIAADDGGRWSLRWRRTPKRALTLEPPPTDATGADSGPAELLWTALSLPGDQQRFEAAVTARAREISAAIGRDPEHVRPICDFVKWERLKLDAHAYIGDSAEDLVDPEPQVRGHRSKYAEATARVSLAIYAADDCVSITAAATLDVLRTFGGADPGDEYLGRALYGRLGVHEVQARLGRDAGTVPPAPRRQARAMEEFFRHAWTRIEALADRFGWYQAVGRPPISPASIAAYLRQFPDVEHARTMLRFLEGTDVRGRDYLTGAVRQTMGSRAGANQHVKVVSPLGASGDSSGWLPYFIGDLPKAERRPVLPLELAVERDEDGEILLWDDFCGTSGHAATTLFQWSGETIKKPGANLDEDLTAPLGAERWARFRRQKVKIAFALARPDGIAKLRAYVREAGLDNVEVLNPAAEVPDTDDFLETAPRLGSDAQRSALRNFLRSKARDVLSPRLEANGGTWSSEKLEDRLLGYSNSQHRVVFFYNVPTVSLTLLWAGLDGVWEPLFPRRPKANR